MIPFGPIALGSLSAPGALSSASVQAAADQLPWAFKLALQVYGTFTGSYIIETSLDGTNWSTAVTASTTAGMFDLVSPTIGVRVTASAMSAGTLYAQIGGLDARGS